MNRTIQLNDQQQTRVLEQARRAGASVQLLLQAAVEHHVECAFVSTDTDSIQLRCTVGVQPENWLGHYVIGEIAIGDETYEFLTHVVDADGDEGGSTITISRPHQVEMLQRRQHWRLEQNLPTDLRGSLDVRQRTDTAASESSVQPIRIYSLSAGGLACYTNPAIQDLLAIGDQVIIRFMPPAAANPLSLPCTVCDKSINDQVELVLRLAIDGRRHEQGFSPSMEALNQWLTELYRAVEKEADAR